MKYLEAMARPTLSPANTHHRNRGSSNRRKQSHNESRPKNTAALSVRTIRPKCTGSGSTTQIAAAISATRALNALAPDEEEQRYRTDRERYRPQPAGHIERCRVILEALRELGARAHDGSAMEHRVRHPKDPGERIDDRGSRVPEPVGVRILSRCDVHRAPDERGLVGFLQWQVSLQRPEMHGGRYDHQPHQHPHHGP